MDSQGDVLSLVQQLRALTDRYRVNDFLDLFSEDAQFQIVGHSTLVGKEKISKVFEYDAAANTELRFSNFVPNRNGLTCQLIARNDRLKAMGIDNVFYTSCVILLKEGRIQQFVATIEEEGQSGSPDGLRFSFRRTKGHFAPAVINAHCESAEQFVADEPGERFCSPAVVGNNRR